MRRIILAASAALAVGAAAACGSRAGEDTGAAADTLTRRQKDSLVSTMPLPGASRIRDAQKAADAQRERNALLDSIGR